MAFAAVPRLASTVPHPGTVAPRQPYGERLAGHELHGDEDAVVVAPDFVHRHDVGVRHARHRLRFAQQACLQLVLGRVALARLTANQLQRHLAIELGIVGGVDHAVSDAAG